MEELIEKIYEDYQSCYDAVALWYDETWGRLDKDDEEGYNHYVNNTLLKEVIGAIKSDDWDFFTGDSDITLSNSEKTKIKNLVNSWAEKDPRKAMDMGF